MLSKLPVEQPGSTFATLLKQLRAEARLTQEELAYAAGLSPRSISDLERGISRTARKDTALLLADALALVGPPRAAFVAAARGRAEASGVLAARDATAAGVPVATMCWVPGIESRPLPGEVDFRKLIDTITAAITGSGGVLTGIWLVGRTAQDATEASPSRALSTSDCRARFRGRSRVVRCGGTGHSEIQSGCRL